MYRIYTPLKGILRLNIEQDEELHKLLNVSRQELISVFNSLVKRSLIKEEKDTEGGLPKFGLVVGWKDDVKNEVEFKLIEHIRENYWLW